MAPEPFTQDVLDELQEEVEGSEISILPEGNPLRTHPAVYTGPQGGGGLPPGGGRVTGVAEPGREAGGGGGVAQQGGNSPAGLSIPPPTQGLSPWGQVPMGPAQPGTRSVDPTRSEELRDHRRPGIGRNHNVNNPGSEEEIINPPSSRSGGRHSNEKKTINHPSVGSGEPPLPPTPSPPDSMVSMFSEADTEAESKREGKQGKQGSLVTHAGEKRGKRSRVGKKHGAQGMEKGLVKTWAKNVKSVGKDLKRAVSEGLQATKRASLIPYGKPPGADDCAPELEWDEMVCPV